MSSDNRPSSRPGPLDPPFFPDDRVEVPPAVESNSDTLWNEFNKLQSPPARVTTQPLDPFAPTVPANLARTSAAAAPLSLVSTLTAQEVMVEARRFNRVCPKPDEWMALYELLPGKVQQGRLWEPPPPITGPAWAVTPSMAKRIVLRDHIEWAERHGALDAVMTFLKGLAESQWHHMDE